MKQLDNQAIQHQKKEQTYKRHQKARHLIGQGLDIFAQARAQQYRDKKLVRLACHKWMDAIQFNRLDPKPYLFLAQVFLTFKSYGQALKYLREVKKLTPNDPDLRLMMDMIPKSTTTSQKPPTSQPATSQSDVQSTQPTQSTQETERDLDELYDKVESFLNHKVSVVMANNPLPKMPSILPEEIEQMKVVAKELRGICHSVQVKLDILDKEMCISQLAIKFHPLMKLKKSFELLIGVSEKLKVVYSEIRVQTMTILRYVQQIQTEEITEINIDNILDQCDQYSDKIEQIAYNNPDYYLVVEPAYEKLLAAVERLQDEIENHEEEMLF